MAKSPQRSPGEIIRSLRAAKGITGAELARKVGTTKETIHKIETGKTRQSSILPEIARELGVALEDISFELAEPTGLSEAPQRAARTAGFARSGEGIPLYSAGESAESTIMVAFEPIDFLRRPAPLMHVQGAYAILVDGSSMVPALEPGDVVLVNPRLFPRKSMNALFLQNGDDQVRGALRRYEGQTERLWRAFQWQPQKTLTYEKAEWPRVHAIVEKYSWR